MALFIGGGSSLCFTRGFIAALHNLTSQDESENIHAFSPQLSFCHVSLL